MSSSAWASACKRACGAGRRCFSILPVGVSIIDGAGQVQEANAALARALGLSREAILDGEYRQLAFRRPDGTPMLATEFATAQARQRHQIVSADLQVIRRDGSARGSPRLRRRCRTRPSPWLS